MNQHEQELIAGLAEKLRNAPAPQIDHEAEDLIRRTIGARPDALYVLTQTVLIQEMALDQAKSRIQQLEQGAGQPGFLGGQPPAQGGYAQSAYSQPAYSQPVYAQPPQPVYVEAPPQRSGFASFLHNAATTAAGVLAGEVAFESLSSLFSGGRGGGFFGGQSFGPGMMPGGETIVNNYYEERGGDGGFRDAGGESRFAEVADSSDQDISPDIEDDRDDSGGDSGGDSFFDDGGGSDDSF